MRGIARSLSVSVTILVALAAFFVSPVAAATSYSLTPFTYCRCSRGLRHWLPGRNARRCRREIR